MRRTFLVLSALLWAVPALASPVPLVSNVVYQVIASTGGDTGPGSVSTNLVATDQTHSTLTFDGPWQAVPGQSIKFSIDFTLTASPGQFLVDELLVTPGGFTSDASSFFSGHNRLGLGADLCINGAFVGPTCSATLLSAGYVVLHNVDSSLGIQGFGFNGLGNASVIDVHSQFEIGVDDIGLMFTPFILFDLNQSTPPTVPEPASVFLLASGLAASAALRPRRGRS